MNTCWIWEFRIFGIIPADLLTWVQKLVKFKHENIEDNYIWTARCRCNIKIRDQILKVKRINENIPKYGIQKWETSIHEFPLSSEVINDLNECLGLELPMKSTDELSLLNLQKRFHLMHIITVLKERRKYYWPMDKRVSIELTEIKSPEKLSSICLEGTSLESVIKSVDHLNRYDIWKDKVKTGNFMDVIKVWSSGKKFL